MFRPLVLASCWKDLPTLGDALLAWLAVKDNTPPRWDCQSASVAVPKAEMKRLRERKKHINP